MDERAWTALSHHSAARKRTALAANVHISPPDVRKRGGHDGLRIATPHLRMTTFTIAEAHPAALRMVRKALAQQGLRVPAELNIGARIRQQLGAGVAPCMVLYVDDPLVLLEAVVFYRGAAMLIPQPVVVTAAGGHTEVLLRGLESLTAETPESVRDPLLNFHRRIARAMESIAERQGACLAVTPR